MATSTYDNLAPRKGSPVYSIRSGSATGSVNVSETRDLSRQSEQQARIQHRKAIQVRKVAFLVIVLFLLIGGLSYAIYRVVSNESDENETERMKLDKNKITSVNGMPRSSVSDMLDKSVNISPEASEIMVRSTSVKQPFTSSMSTMQQEYQSSSNETRSVISSLTPSLSKDVGATHYSSAKSPQSVSQPDTMTLAKSSHSKHDQSSKIPNDRVVQSMSTHTPILYASTPKNTEILLSATSSPWKHKTSTLEIKDQVSSIKESGVSWSKQTESIAQNMQTASPTTSSKHSQNIFYSPSSEVLPLSLFEKSLYSEIASTQSIKIDETTSSSSTQKLLHSEVVPTQSNTASSFFTPSVSSRDQQTSSATISNQRVYQSSTLLPSVSTLINELEPTTTKSLSAFTGKDEAPPSTFTVVQQTENSTLLSTSTTTRLNTTTEIILVDSSKTVQSVFPSPIAKIANTSSTILMTSPIPTSLLLATLALDTSIIINETTTGSVGQVSMTYSLDGQMTNNSISPSKTFVTPIASSSIPVVPYYHEWGNWSDCSLNCGGGYKHRTRQCSHDGECTELGPKINISACNLQKCNETIFSVSLNATDYQWTDDYYNTSSTAYIDLVNRLKRELQLLYGPNVSVTIDNIRQGSVIVSFTLTLSTTETIEKLTNTFGDGKLGNLSISLVKLINNMVPGEPSFLTTQNTTTNSTMVHWSSLNDNNGILLGYKILITPGNITLDLRNPLETSYEVTNLTHDTSYTVQLLGYNINGDGVKTIATFKTNDLPPFYLPWGSWSNCSLDCGGGLTRRNRNCSKEGLCSHLGEAEQIEHCNVYKCNETSYSVKLNVTNAKWTDDLSNKSSKAYKEMLEKFIAELRKKYPNATFSPGDISRGSIIFNIKITFPGEETPDTETVADGLKDGLGNYTVEVKDVENNNVPRQPPGFINVTMTTHHSTTVKWLAISEGDSNGAVLEYFIVLYLGENKTTEFNVSAKASDTEFSYLLSKLAPNTTYRFYMYGKNINGEGVDSNLIYFTTKVQIPKITSRNVSQITINHAVLYWSRIVDHNATYGIISGYKIVLSGEYDLKVSAEETRANLTNLLPNTTYTVTVFGYNDYGDGVVSNTSFTTMVQIPKITSRNVSQITINHAVLYWSRIADNNATYGIISGYKIVLSGEYELQVSAEETRANLINLLPNTTYTVTVFGYNDYGDGVVSNTSFTTMVQIPKITSRNISQITINHTVLYWSRIADNNATYGIISGYKIVLSGEYDLQVSAEEARANLTNLLPNTTYTATVFGYNDYGDGVVSNASFTTMALIPKPKFVIVTNTTSNTAVLKWEKIPPNEKYGKIHGYRILIINGSILSSVHAIANVSQVVLQNLSSNTTYRVQILGFNQYGDGLMSDVYSFTTLENVKTGLEMVSSSLMMSSHHQPNATEKLEHVSRTLSEGTMPSIDLRPSTSKAMLRMTYSSVSQTKSSNTIGLKESQSSKSSLMTSYEFESHSSSSKSSSQSVPFVLPYSSFAVPSSHSLVIRSTYAHSSTHGHAPSTSAVPVASSVTPSSAVIPTTKSSSPEPQAPTNETKYIVGKIRLVDENFISDLNNPEADTFKALARQLEELLHALFKANGLVFEKVVVIGFAEGSIYVKFFVLVDTINNYQEENVITILANASRNGGLGDKPFEIRNEDFHTENSEPTPKPTTNEGNKGLQKNDDDDDSALIVAVVMIVLLACGMACVVVYIGKKRNWFKRGKRKVVPDDDDDDDDDMYPQPGNDKMRLKTARGPRKTRGEIINAGQSTTEC